MEKRWICVCIFSVCLVLLSGEDLCAEAGDQGGYEDVLIEDVPHVRQKPDFCGEACAEMYLRKLGSDIDQDDVFDLSGVDPLKGRGCITADLSKTLKNIGFKVGPVWYKVSVKEAEKQIEEQFKTLHADLVKGIPSIVCTHYNDKPNTTEHFRLILGYDSKKDEVIYHEPAERAGAYRRMKRETFLKLWSLKYDKEQWTLIRFRLDADKIKKHKRADGFTDADYAQHMMKLKKKIPNKSFTVLMQKPFVVLGDESPAMVRRRSVSTIKWAVDMIKQDYFEKEPDTIIDIWLFKDKESYRKHTKQVFNDSPDTPYGYFSHTHNALIMNIATGGGTLVHEIVHPFVSSNFPQCPAWFNEGLASLYEQCREKNGHINGSTNWRLAGLQRDIKKGTLSSFKTLMETTDRQFYNGNNYAQARYLCYYLQEKGLLVKYYHQFRKNYKDDPSGYETLQKVLGEKDVEAFQKRWEKYVMALVFRG